MFKLFRRKRQAPVTPPTLKKTASKKTKDAIAFFNDKKPATDLIEMDKRKSFVHSGYTKTVSDKFFEVVETKDFWLTLLLIAAAALLVAVGYWGIKQ